MWCSSFIVFSNYPHVSGRFLKAYILHISPCELSRFFLSLNILIYQLVQSLGSSWQFHLSQRSIIFCALWQWFPFKPFVWKISSPSSSALSMFWGKTHIHSGDALLSQSLLTLNLHFKAVLLKNSLPLQNYLYLLLGRLFQ